MQSAKRKMQNNNSKLKIDLKKRAYLYALEIIKFIDSLDKKEKVLNFTLLFCALRFAF